MDLDNSLIKQKIDKTAFPDSDILMLAISPEMPDITVETLSFNVLSDKNNTYAKKVGLV